MLETVTPREQAGRDSFSRYKAQIRSAALASLAILEDRDIDCVYCDLHDDFVIRKQDINGLSYLFYQVKTKDKQNHNWTIGDLLDLNTKIRDQSKHCTNRIKNSFIGKMLLHTVMFDKHCSRVVFQTNINNHDDVDDLVQAIVSGEYNNKYAKLLVERFNECYGKDFSNEEIKARLSKISFETDCQYLKSKDHNFESYARGIVYKFSEIDLKRTELKETLLKLLDLVGNKSSGVIENINAESIEKLAGIQINDLLSILSISQDAYKILQQGGDRKAVKSASIIQRMLENAGAGNNEIEYCSRCKTNWDIWLRNNRHSLPELDFNSITQKVNKILEKAVGQISLISEIQLSSLRKPIEDLLIQLKSEGLLYDLNQDLILGGFFAELVRGRS